MWWQYSITFVGSLLVALFSVWIAQSWSTKRERSKALQNLKSETSSNIKDSKLILDWLNKDFDGLTKDETGVTPCLRLHDSAWYSVKGTAIVNYAITAKLEDAYRLIGVVNNLLQRIEELRYGRILERSKGFTKEAAEKAGLQVVIEEWEAAMVLSADMERAFKTTYTQHIAVAEGYIQKLLMLLQELETQIAEFCSKGEGSTTTVLEKRQMNSKAVVHISFAAALFSAVPFLTGGHRIALIVVIAILTLSSLILYFFDRFSSPFWRRLVRVSADIEVGLTASGFAVSNIGISLLRAGWLPVGSVFLLVGGLILVFGIRANLRRVKREKPLVG